MDDYTWDERRYRALGSMLRGTAGAVEFIRPRENLMGLRNELPDHDVLREAMESEEQIVGVAVRIFSNQASTWFEIWEQGPGYAPGGTLKSFRRYARHTTGQPDARVLAGWLARLVGSADRAGWEDIT